MHVGIAFMRTQDLISVIEENGSLDVEVCLKVPVAGLIQQISLSGDEQVVALSQTRNVKLLSAASLFRALDTRTVSR